MKTFLKWCEEEQIELRDVDAEKVEHRVRTGLTQNYPDAYVRGQYPHKYFNPTKATADLDIAQKPATGYKGQKAASE